MDFFNMMLFEGIAEQECRAMMDCFGVQMRQFDAGQTIFEYGSGNDQVGILQQGRASLVRIDSDGGRTVLERLEPGGVFGEMMAFPCVGADSIWVQCDEMCIVALIRYDQITKRCEKACRHHSRLVENMFGLMRQKAIALSERVEILSRRTIRDKLSAYFLLQSLKNGEEKFNLPFSYSALGEYICADRSAMMRELRKMKEDGLLQTKGRQIFLGKSFLEAAGVVDKL
ncbi:MAG: Crp/Fnr family transcriptional regulator [Oscillospiraceae bacterium]|nr:Crp/Fnr family transcriptional regulator [Oscillospiraceae bacterium]MDD5921388.1 Crp/Fnr family transcriptional regulator [Oscillospiraceae bacterium]